MTSPPRSTHRYTYINTSTPSKGENPSCVIHPALNRAAVSWAPLPPVRLQYFFLSADSTVRRNRPLFFIDIAVPRDIEARVNEIDNVYLYDIDDLKGIVELNREERQREAERAHHIVAEEAVKFCKWLETLDVVPTIVALRRKAESIRQNELNKTLSHLPHFTERDKQAIVLLTESIVRKLLHDPIVFLKKKSDRSTKQQFMDFSQQLFNLMDGPEMNASPLQGEVETYPVDLEAAKVSEK
ncbi:MAG: hypothetical protein HGB17_02430 [Syntrophobacteraceae bacterium]|nr:hypothetical protein [Syntrophobacteraceae bacterium]